MSRVWEPAPDDVKAQLPVRIGRPFDDTTKPSLVEVLNLISQVAVEIELEVGVIPSPLYEEAGRVAVLGTAYYIEATLIPEQQMATGSGADRFWALYQRGLASLRLRLAEYSESQGTGGDIGTMVTPSAYVDPTLATVLYTDLLP